MATATRDLPGGRQSVLILEDDLLHSALLQMVLEAAGFEVHVASTVEEALETLGRAWPDAVLADWDMDGMDGRALLRALRAQVPGCEKVPTVLMTDREMNARTQLELSMEGYVWILQKPIVVTSLPKLILHTTAETAGTAGQARGGTCGHGQAEKSEFSARVIRSGRTASGAFMDAVR